MISNDPVTNGYPIRFLRSGDFVLTEARYADGSRLPWHAHGHPTFLLTLAGGFRQRHRGGTLECSRNQVLYEPADTAHSTTVTGKATRMFFFEVSKETPDFLFPFGHNREIQLESGDVSRLLFLLRNELYYPDEVSDLAIRGLALELMAAVARTEASSERRAPPWFLEVKDAISTNLNLSLTEMSIIADRHPSHVARAFRRCCGCSAGEYVRKLKVGRAKTLMLTTRTPLKEIAKRLGFSDQSHFTRLFRRYTGMSPALFRQARIP